jgi:CheY-like chemotaxis protein
MDFARNHIMVVDNYVDAADTTVELLSIWGYDAFACYTGAAALESISLRRPDVVVLELDMPSMDGFQFARVFHKLPGCGLIPIIAISGYSSAAYRVNACEIGIRHYLLKPVDPEFLREVLAQEIESMVAPNPLHRSLARCIGLQLPKLEDPFSTAVGVLEDGRE